MIEDENNHVKEDVSSRGDIYKQQVVITGTMVSETMQLLEMLPENE